MCFSPRSAIALQKLTLIKPITFFLVQDAV